MLPNAASFWQEGTTAVMALTVLATKSVSKVIVVCVFESLTCATWSTSC